METVVLGTIDVKTRRSVGWIPMAAEVHVVGQMPVLRVSHGNFGDEFRFDTLIRYGFPDTAEYWHMESDTDFRLVRVQENQMHRIRNRWGAKHRSKLVCTVQ